LESRCSTNGQEAQSRRILEIPKRDWSALGERRTANGETAKGEQQLFFGLVEVEQ
jgi:hypothetical protein